MKRFARFAISSALCVALFAGLVAFAFAQTQYDDDFKGTTLDKKWTFYDINPGQPGSAVVKDGALVMTNYGAGDDNNDCAVFVSQRISGDFIATLKIR